MANQNALTHDLTFGDGLERVYESQRGTDTTTLNTVAAARVSVSIAAQDKIDLMTKNFGGDLLKQAPSIVLNTGGVQSMLTWQEAYNLAQMLVSAVNVAYYG